MGKWNWSRVGHVAAAVALLGAAGCSGGSSGSTAASGVDALTVADKVSVVDAKAETGGAGKLLAKLAGVWSGAPAGSDYEKDLPSVYVHEKAADSFGMVNEILCMMAQTKYGEMVNKGEYKALVNEKVCRGNDDVSNASSSKGTSSNAPEYMEWTVRSTRADNDSPQIIEAWVHEKAEDGRPPVLIQAKAVITEGSSAENPYGIFTMNFVGYPVIDGVPVLATPGFKGILTSQREDGKVVLKFAELGDGENTAIALEKNGTTGGGRVAFDNEWEGQGEMFFAYNAGLFHRQDASGAHEICLDRDNFEISAWRYGMYDATTGNRVNVNSGFPINTEADGTGKHGWVGYWGLWVPDDVTIENGDQVYKQNYNGGTSEAYTVLQVGGKLKKHTKNTATLSAIKNIPLETNDFATGKMIRVIWNGTGLRKTAEADPNPGGPPAWTEMDVPYSTDNLPWGELNFWSQALGGQVRIPLANCTRLESGNSQCDAPTGTTDIVYFVENIVYPNDDTIPETLACYDNCPDISAGNVSGSGFGLSEAALYTFNSGTDMVLKKNGVPLLQTADGQQYGYNSGPLFDAALDDNPETSPLACDWTGPMGEKTICGWKAWSVLDEFYTWETGLQNWNQLTVLKNAQGDPLKFEQPLRIEYTHSAASGRPDFKYNGTKFFLDYNGFGELHGIPGKCVDPSTGQTIACGNQTRWVPEFTIPEGSDASYIDKNGDPKQAKIKPLEMEQRMTKLDNVGDCSGLPFGDYTLPTIADWSNPNLGTEPVVTDAPAVIGGVVQ